VHHTLSGTGGRARLEGGGLLLWAVEEGMGLAKARVVCSSLVKGGCASSAKNKPGCCRKPAREGHPGGGYARSGDALGCHREGVQQRGCLPLWVYERAQKKGVRSAVGAHDGRERARGGTVVEGVRLGCWPSEMGAAA